MSHVLDVLITVDTEIGEPLSPDWQSSCLEAEWRRDIDGATSEGDYGLMFQMQCLNAHGLRASVFSDIDPDGVRLSTDQRPLAPRLTRTACRYIEQLQGGRA